MDVFTPTKPNALWTTLKKLGVTLKSYGRIEAELADLLRIRGSGSFQNQGAIAADGGAIEIQCIVTYSSSGPNAAEITLRIGLVRVGLNETSGARLTNSGVLSLTGGALSCRAKRGAGFSR